MFLEDGIGCAKDPTEAVVWYTRAAEQRDPDGLYNLGQCYEHGVGVPVPDGLLSTLLCYDSVETLERFSFVHLSLRLLGKYTTSRH